MPAKYSTNDSELKEIRDAFDYDTNQWAEIRAERLIDMRYVSGNPWSDTDRLARQKVNRPVLSLDELGQYVNQVINDVRQHKRAIKVTPQGNGANDATANFRANLYRQIEYRSNAQIAYTTMFENAVQGSYGFFRIKHRYVSQRSTDQELIIDPIPNPDLVTPDSDALMPDGSDLKRAFIHESWRIDDFKAKFPKATVRDFTGTVRNSAPAWIKDESVMLAEFWDLEPKTRTLLIVQGLNGQPQGIFEDELDEPQHAALKNQPLIMGPNGLPKTRDVDTATVRMRLTNGVEILEETNYPTTTIPLICCYGKVLYVDEGAGAKRKMMSMVRLARDPYMLYCYYRTCEAELVGMTPKTPFIGFVGQFRGQETDWQRAAHEPVAFLQAHPVTEATGQQVLPIPQRQPYDPPIQSLELGAEAARRAIQAAMGQSPLPTSAQRRNEKSGVALKQIDDAAQQGSYHFVDHYEQAITRGGVILEDWTPHYYNTPRDVTTRQPNDTSNVIRINDTNRANFPKGQDQPMMVGLELHDVTLSTGPSDNSEREAASDFADSLAQNPQVFPLIADLVVKLKNLGPIGDELSDRLKALLPPSLQAGKDGQPTVPMLLQQRQQAQKMIEELSAHVQQLTEQANTKQIENDTKKQIALADNAVKLEIAQIDAQKALAVAEVAAKSKADQAELDRRIQILETMIHADKELRLEHHSAAHDVGMAALKHGQAKELATDAHDHAMELATTPPPASPEPTNDQAGA